MRSDDVSFFLSSLRIGGLSIMVAIPIAISDTDGSQIGMYPDRDISDTAVLIEPAQIFSLSSVAQWQSIRLLTEGL